MKTTLIFIAVCGLSLSALAKGGHSSGGHASSGGSHSINGHVTKNGTYVAPSRATNPDSTKGNNYSTKGNVNPYTGKEGTKN